MTQPQQQLTFQVSPSTLITGIVGLMLVIPVTIFMTLWLLKPQIAAASENTQQANTGAIYQMPATVPAGSTCVDTSAAKDGHHDHEDGEAAGHAVYTGYGFTSGSITQHQTETNTNYYDSFNERGDVYRGNIYDSLNGNFSGNTANSNNGNFSGNTANSNNTLNSNNGNFSNNLSNNTANSNNTSDSNNTDVDVDVLSNNGNENSNVNSNGAQNSNTEVEDSIGTAVINGNLED